METEERYSPLRLLTVLTDMATTQSMVLKYAVLLGWRVLPLHSVNELGTCSCGKDCGTSAGKHPRTKHGLRDASTDPETIKAWRERWPNANVGIATGSGSGIVAVDLDGEEGVAQWKMIVKTRGWQGAPLIARTGGGGVHLIYAHPGGVVANRTKLGGYKIDVRGDGGYIVAPSSRHRSGNLYRWLKFGVPGEMPEWLREWIGTAPRAAPATQTASVAETGAVAQRAARYLAKIPGAISGCGGHSQTFVAARAIVYGFDLGPQVGYELLANLYNPRCEPPWSERELRHKCEDADLKPSIKPRGWLLK